MKKMKKILTVITTITCLLATGLLGACGTSSTSADGDGQADGAQAQTYKIMVTNFAEYDWTREILGTNIENVELVQVIDNGVDLHSFTPTVEDIAEISTCDLFIYTGGVSSDWVDDVLAQATNTDMIVLNLMEALGDNVKMEESVEGMESSDHDHDHDEEATTEDDHDHDHDEEATTEDDHDHDEEATTEDDHDHDEEATTEDDHDHDDAEIATTEHGHEDEHIWLSLKNAMLLSNEVAKALSELDPTSVELYSDNAAAYISSLASLDAQYHETAILAERKVILLADRFPFRYLVDDYGIEYYAAFPGCSAETEASFETIVFLAGKVDELGLPFVLTTETGNEIAQTVIDNTQDKTQTILSLNSLQSSSVADGKTYLELMTENLDVLTTALN